VVINTKVLIGVSLLLLVSLGCGKSTEEQTKPAESAQAARPIPLQSDTDTSLVEGVPPVLKTSALVVEELKRLTEQHKINRNEYWSGAGGVVGNDYFEIWYTDGPATITHGMRMLDDIMKARGEFETYFGRAPMETLVILLPLEMEHYSSWTGREWWYYSEIKADTMTIQPLYILSKRSLMLAIPHEYYQWAMSKITNNGAPRWLEEGFASHLSGEGNVLTQQIDEFPDETHAMSPKQVEDVLIREESRQESRIAYYQSYRMVKTLVDSFGDEKLKQAVLLLGQGHTRDEAFEQAFGLSYEQTLESIADRTEHI